ncbi:MAG: GspE/PulE family protein [Acidobacteriota bacterium]
MTANPNQKLRLGELLVREGKISEEQLEKALVMQKKSGSKLGELLVKEGFITKIQLAEVLESQLDIRSIDLRVAPLDIQAARRIPENLARRHTLIPIQVADGHLMLAMKDPLDQMAIQDVRLIASMPVTPLLADENDIVAAIERIFSQARVAEQAAEDLARNSGPVIDESAASLDIESAPMVRLVNSIIENAVRSRASDIHIEPKQDRLRIRTRIDGVLHDVLTTDARLHSSLVSRIKVMSSMNIAEKRQPQDGKIVFGVDNRKIDLRVSTMPTTYGEKVVMRILDRASFLIGKRQLGFDDDAVAKFDRMAALPWGIILVTGPTGSGKTTTLYAMLSEMDSYHQNIATLEDPVEYDLDNISQTQMNPQANVTFATGLRTLMRQDPDVIMVGEIRDEETADIAVRAALTGHLVLSTLHTNDAPSAVTRLMDMNVQPYRLSSALAGVIAQRLVRKICSECKEQYEADERERNILGLPDNNPIILSRGKGCPICNKTGFSGRIGVFEIMELDRDLRIMISTSGAADQLREAAVRKGMTPLWYDCRDKVLQGFTTLEEALRVTQAH